MTVSDEQGFVKAVYLFQQFSDYSVYAVVLNLLLVVIQFIHYDRLKEEKDSVRKVEFSRG
jgi:hypothetical protein